jgi:predicted unusual protein kinase regulating ubiquinone biosynthesis (AarF/ABC1/UbiB family)
LVFYDFGQAATLNPGQADGILDIIEAIVDSDVDQSLKAFAKMGVLKEDANLEIVRAKVADNFKTGKVKANRKRLSKQGYKFKTEVPSPNTTDATVSSNSTAASSSNSTVKDSDVMQSFTLPAEYAFVGRALIQMDGVGKGLDPEFDFISAAAPSIYEIKGANKYLKEEAAKWFDSFLPHYVSEEEKERRRSARIQKNLAWRNKPAEWY